MDDLLSSPAHWAGALAVVPLGLLLGMPLKKRFPPAVGPALAAALVLAVLYYALDVHAPLALAAPLIVGALMVLGMRPQGELWPVLLALALAGPAAWLLMHGDVPAEVTALPPMTPSPAPRVGVLPGGAAERASAPQLPGSGALGQALELAAQRKQRVASGEGEPVDKPEAGPAAAASAAGGGTLGGNQPAAAQAAASKASRPVARSEPADTPPAPPPKREDPLAGIPVVPAQPATPTYVPPLRTQQDTGSSAGQHPGFAADCRWITPTQWSCPNR